MRQAAAWIVGRGVTHKPRCVACRIEPNAQTTKIDADKAQIIRNDRCPAPSARATSAAAAADEENYPMDLRKLKTLVDLVSESNISELEITEAEGKVRIVKGGVPGSAALPAAAPPPASLPAAFAAGAAAVAAPASAAAPATPTLPEGKFIKSPMVGTFYRSSTPGGKAMVEVGDEIVEGQPVCIIEAMKIMNEIESDLAGTVTRILCENGQAVEFGQPLFELE